jgi:rubrerythrin
MSIEQAGTRVASAPVDAGYAELTVAGATAVGEFRCAECGYGVIVHRTLPPCPMCGGASWEQSAWSPFSRRPAGRVVQ